MAVAVSLDEALDAHRRGEFSAAEQAYREHLAHVPRDPRVLQLLGMLCRQTGRDTDALHWLARAVECDPGLHAAQAWLGRVLHALGRDEEALAPLLAALSLQPDDDASALQLGNALHRLRRFDDAELAYRNAVTANPENIDAWHNLGNTLQALGRFDAACAAYGEALRRRADSADTWNALALARRALGDTSGAVDALSRALSCDARHAPALNNLGVVLKDGGKLDDALRAFRAALDVAPDFADARNNLGNALRMQGHFEVAVASLREALRLHPDSGEAWTNLSAALNELGDYAGALDAAERGTRLSREPHDAWNNLGNALQSSGEVAGAIAAYREALRLRDDSDAHWNLAFAHLLAGEFEPAWREYRWRPARRRALAEQPMLAETLPVDLEGAVILLTKEQGLGDELFFLRFAHRLAERGARLIAKPSPKIATLLERAPWRGRLLFDRVVLEIAHAPPHDCRVLMGDLPRLTGMRTRADIPPALPLVALPERVEAMRERLVALGPGPYVGLTWRAGTTYAEQAANRERNRHLFKSIEPAMLGRALAGRRATWIALQRAPDAAELAALSDALDAPAHDFSDLNDDLEAMAALLLILDEHIGVSNTNMHLAAGLGRTARVLIPHPPEWRWMVDGDSPWFPGFAVYRQRPDRDWSEALARLSGDLGA